MASADLPDAGQDAFVDVPSDPGVAGTESVGDDLAVDAGGKHERGQAVPAVVLAVRREAAMTRSKGSVTCRDAARSVLLGEDEARLDLGKVPLRAVCHLLLSVVLQDVGRCRCR